MGSDIIEKTERITLGAGCFWCTEAIFERIKGVISIEPGYSGGHIKNPSYREVCSGTTGHAEVIQIQFDAAVISLEELLEIYWKTHDPTQLNRQGADIGTQYRSAVFYHTPEQQKVAEELKLKLEIEKYWDSPIVTIIELFTEFYKAENYHREYYENNTNQAYCQFVITPKIKKTKELFTKYLKEV